MAPWRSGYAGVCKTSYTGSIPVGASIRAQARVVELVYTVDLKSTGRKAVRVQVPPRAPNESMTDYINEDFWRNALSQPTWYLLLKDDFSRLEQIAKQEKDYDKRKQIKDKAYGLVEEAVVSGNLVMGSTGDNLDAERKPIDTIVIHHTNSRPGMTLERLNAIQLLRIYGSYFAKPTDPKEEHLKGQPIWSGHFYKSKQVFWGYHWFVREDGTSERILDDSYIGWHAGNWDVNTRSVAICVDDELTDKEPSDAVIDSIIDTILKHYPSFNRDKILGHCDVNLSTECPGHLFHETWRQKILDKLT
jgi:hypothetical protein